VLVVESEVRSLEYAHLQWIDSCFYLHSSSVLADGGKMILGIFRLDELTEFDFLQLAYL
jgi:hypothetical protein